MNKIILTLAALAWSTPAVAAPVVAHPVVIARPVIVARPSVTYRAPVTAPKPISRPARSSTPAASPPLWWYSTNLGAHSVVAEQNFKSKCRRTPPEKRGRICKRALGLST